MAPLKIENIPLSDLKEDIKNARKHDSKNIDAIVGSLKKFGQQKPLVVTKNGIIVAGNGTYIAAKKLGWKSIDIVRTELIGPDLMAYALADNRTAELAAWDVDGLTNAINALVDVNFDLSSIGFDEVFMKENDLESEIAGKTDEDAVPDIPKNVYNVQRGQIYKLGEHRLMCGDSTSEEDVAKLMDGQTVDLLSSDPPYGISLNTDYSNKKGGKVYKEIAGDTDATHCVAALFKFNCRKIIWGANNFYWMLPDLPQSGWIVWDKRCSEQADKALGSPFELAWTDKQKHFQMCRVQHGGAINHDHRHGGETQYERHHPSQKPVELSLQLFERFKAGTNIVDLFGGSGSTLIACEKTKRKCFMMELDEHYCSVIIERWQQFTGNKVELIKS